MRELQAASRTGRHPFELVFLRKIERSAVGGNASTNRRIPNCHAADFLRRGEVPF